MKAQVQGGKQSTTVVQPLYINIQFGMEVTPKFQVISIGEKIELGEMLQQYMQKTDKLLQQNKTNYQNQQVSIKKMEPSNIFTNPKEQVQTITNKSGYNYQRFV